VLGSMEGCQDIGAGLEMQGRQKRARVCRLEESTFGQDADLVSESSGYSYQEGDSDSESVGNSGEDDDSESESEGAEGRGGKSKNQQKKNYACDECGYSASKPALLIQHLRSHSNQVCHISLLQTVKILYVVKRNMHINALADSPHCPLARI
jgi:hypothetical protein